MSANLLAEKEVAKRLGFSPRTLQKWRRTGSGPVFMRISPRCVRYREEDLEAWLKERRRRSTSDEGRSKDDAGRCRQHRS